MAIRRRRHGNVTRTVTIVAFIAAASFALTWGDSVGSYTSAILWGEPGTTTDQEATTLLEYTDDSDGAVIVEHDFSILIDGGQSSMEDWRILSKDSDEELAVDQGDPNISTPTAQDSTPKTNTAAGTLDKYHVVVTVNDEIYVQWQARMCYYFYKKLRDANPDGPMGGFTRLMHSGQGDEWMDEIPSVVVDGLPPEIERVAGGYVVLQRPYGLLQWVRDYMPKIPEKYILMSEPDHLFINPPPLLATPTKPAAFPFFYIEPQKPENKPLIDKFNVKNAPITRFAPIGNSPVMIHKDQMAPIVEIWANLSIEIKKDHEASEKWGWVQEMYAWSIASTQIDQIVEYTLVKEFMLQPPWDTRLTVDGKDAYVIHFTYGDDFNEHGVFTPGKIGAWHFDKRDYTVKYPPLNFPMPPSGCDNEAVKRLIASVNEASANLPGWAERAFKSVDEVVPAYGK